MTDISSIELAGAWKQDFVNRTSKTRLVIETVSKGVETTYVEQVPCDASRIPVLLLGNKYDLVSLTVCWFICSVYVCLCVCILCGSLWSLLLIHLLVLLQLDHLDQPREFNYAVCILHINTNCRSLNLLTV